jgi:YfiH family protein
MPPAESPRNPPEAPVVHHAFPGLPGVRAFFTTRRGGFSGAPYEALNLGFFTGDDVVTVRENWRALLDAQGLGGRDPVLPRLCHGADVLDADALADALDEGAPRSGNAGAPDAPPADAVFTSVPGRVVAVTTADCLAALVVDPETRCVAAIHAGWRGARENILGLTLERLFREGRCRPGTTRVALGPCLSLAALEVGEDVAATLPPAHVTRLNGRPHFDLRACNRAQAVAAGMRPEAVADLGACTFGEPGLYFSHRRSMRDKTGATGRLAACIALI